MADWTWEQQALAAVVTTFAVTFLIVAFDVLFPTDKDGEE